MARADVNGARPESGGARRPGRHRRRGTAVSEKGRQRSEEILDAATAILAGGGHAQLSLRKIAAAAGMRMGHLQYYYAARQDVVRALLERYLARSLHALERRMEQASGAPEARFRACIDAILEGQDSDADCRMFWEVWALAARDRSVAGATRAFYERYRAQLAGLIVRAAPSLGDACALRRATLLVAALEGLTVFRLGAARSGPSRAALAGEIQALFLPSEPENLP